MNSEIIQLYSYREANDLAETGTAKALLLAFGKKGSIVPIAPSTLQLCIYFIDIDCPRIVRQIEFSLSILRIIAMSGNGIQCHYRIYTVVHVFQNVYIPIYENENHNQS